MATLHRISFRKLNSSRCVEVNLTMTSTSTSNSALDVNVSPSSCLNDDFRLLDAAETLVNLQSMQEQQQQQQHNSSNNISPLGSPLSNGNGNGINGGDVFDLSCVVAPPNVTIDKMALEPLPMAPPPPPPAPPTLTSMGVASSAVIMGPPQSMTMAATTTKTIMKPPPPPPPHG